MIPVLEDAVLGSLLDCQNFDLLNVGLMIPVPTGLVNLNDPTLNDPRVPPLASVRDEHVSISAAIDQSKLSFDAEIPLDWLGTGSTQAATGDLVERLSKKGVPNGYAAVGSTLKLSATNVTTGVGSGTASAVAFNFPSLLTNPGDTITTAGTNAVSWANAPNGSYLGVNGPDGLTSNYVPAFITGQLPPEIIPDIDATKFSTGTFAVETLPVASGINQGIAPAPGEIGDPHDYLGRDMEWHTFSADISYQPVAPKPVITLDSWTRDEVFITVRSTLLRSSVFIRINTGPWKIGQIKKGETDVHDTVSVHDGDIIWGYTAKAGYNNSQFSTWKVKTPLTMVT